ncbi:hypothetical protein J8V57_01380 [Xenorhabdus sp. PB61.4]|uniref:hypothetical protein n=1 Tax=Xenorhabdus sp. PB61.4 TaxID=2788940 RepID=UPI001E548E51|nr:hypothetical protein [Xenorhabdus sp. PB61.4]MCC8364942.1 hypothetical protein [Xenorhabdus sp. PB61.4]
MNLLKHTVKKVLSEPVQAVNHDKPYWYIEVRVSCYGVERSEVLSFPNKEECEKVKVGYEYLA